MRAAAEPEGIIGRVRFEKVRQLVNVIHAQIRAQQVAQQMQRGAAEGIGAMEDGSGPPVPELLHAGREEAFRLRIPEPEMQIERKRNFRVEVIAFPFPTGLENHGGKVIGGVVLQLPIGSYPRAAASWRARWASAQSRSRSYCTRNRGSLTK